MALLLPPKVPRLLVPAEEEADLIGLCTGQRIRGMGTVVRGCLISSIQLPPTSSAPAGTSGDNTLGLAWLGLTHCLPLSWNITSSGSQCDWNEEVTRNGLCYFLYPTRTTFIVRQFRYCAKGQKNENFFGKSFAIFEDYGSKKFQQIAWNFVNCEKVALRVSWNYLNSSNCLKTHEVFWTRTKS